MFMRSSRPPQPLFEPLESRQLLSAAPVPPAVDSHGVLNVLGSNKSDSISVALKLGDPTLYVVTVNGTATEIAVASVTGGILVDGKNGSDTIAIVAAVTANAT